MAEKFNPDKYASGLYGRTEQYADKVRKLYTKAVDELLLLASSADIKPNEMFRFADNSKMSAKATAILRTLYSNVYAVTKGGVKSEWGYANLSCDELVTDIFGKGVMKDNHYARWFSRNQEAMDAFFARKKDGLNLSQRVWNHTGLLREEMEMALTVSMGAGESAATVSRKVREYLNDPERLYRRVKDEDGNLQLSKAAKAYRPGQGVYRSAYKNAMRLTRTETNMAYRTADYERWQQLDFVVGVNIALSASHPEEDMCDFLAGKYPKNFKFKGWHPHCFCIATPILATPEEMIAMQKQILNGEDVNAQSVNTITKIPDSSKEWLDGKRERAKGWSSMPYFIKDNPRYIRNFKVDTYDDKEKKFTRARKTTDSMNNIINTYLASKYKGIPNTELSAIHHYTRGGGLGYYRQLNKQLNTDNLNDFNTAFSDLVSRGLDKLTPIEGTVYRGTILKRNVLNEYLSNVGGTMTHKMFTSASELEGIAKNFYSHKDKLKKTETRVMFHIQSKSGKKIADISEFSRKFGRDNQREVLFDKGTKFKVIDVKIDNGIYTFKIEEL